MNWLPWNLVFSIGGFGAHHSLFYDDWPDLDQIYFQGQIWSHMLSTLMMDIPRDLVWDLPWVQQSSYLEEGPLMRMLPLYLHINKKFDDD